MPDFSNRRIIKAFNAFFSPHAWHKWVEWFLDTLIPSLGVAFPASRLGGFHVHSLIQIFHSIPSCVRVWIEFCPGGIRPPTTSQVPIPPWILTLQQKEGLWTTRLHWLQGRSSSAFIRSWIAASITPTPTSTPIHLKPRQKNEILVKPTETKQAVVAFHWYRCLHGSFHWS